MTPAIRTGLASDLPSLEPLLTFFVGDEPGRRVRFLRALDAGEIHVVVEDRDIVALAWIQPEGFFGHAFLNLISVRADRRRTGIAALLLSEVESRATSDRVFTSTNASNHAMQAVCEANGWSRCGEVDALDVGDPEVIYVKPTTAAAVLGTRSRAMSVAQVRIARPTDRLDDVVSFYRDGLGLAEIARFHDHAGYDGVMLALPGRHDHLEFTSHRASGPCRAPSRDNLLVLYIPDAERIAALRTSMTALGYAPVAAENPYWEDHGAVTFEDPDGWRIVLFAAPGFRAATLVEPKRARSSSDPVDGRAQR